MKSFKTEVFEVGTAVVTAICESCILTVLSFASYVVTHSDDNDRLLATNTHESENITRKSFFVEL